MRTKRFYLYTSVVSDYTVISCMNKEGHTVLNTIDLRTLNPLERHIHEVLLAQKDTSGTLRITQAAEVCNCSVSKISKFVRKLGFLNYKQYRAFLNGKDVIGYTATNEIQRIRAFLDAFDSRLVDDLYALIVNHKKLVLFGYGPSLLCAEYFSYRFRNCTDITTMAVSDPVAAKNMVDEVTLLVILTETGRFHSFQDIYASAKKKQCDVIIVSEEFNTELASQCDKIFYLAPQPQPNHLQAYEKSRTTFFIFLEEVIQRFLSKKP